MGLPSALARDLDDYVDAFERALAQDAGAALAEYLPPREHPAYLAVLRELVRVKLEISWRQGECLRLPDFQERFPELFQDRESLEAIAFEEYRLRRQFGDGPTADEYRERWGVDMSAWPKGPPSSPDESLPEAEEVWPLVGTEVLGFQLLAELGRGAFGRVYLVRQEALAGRLVVLKISRHITREMQVLAQLQHTNIVPVYSVHHADQIHALCMPFLGSATLADIIRDLGGHHELPQSGQSLVDTAQARLSTTRQAIRQSGVPIEDGSAAGLEIRPEAAPVAWKQLARLTYVQAVLWLGYRLADGLAHAHERGILHRDLKPANVLLTDDGQPMLLDFNLSEDVKLRSSARAAFQGGTLPYMAPEHLAAFQHGTSTVDARSDVYALGVILFELLTGRQPFPVRMGPLESVLDRMIDDRRGPPPRLRDWNRAVSPAVESMVRHCLAADPNRRYQSARQLQEDLQRQAEHLPLAYAPDPSLRERARKLVRRHPRLVLAAIAGLVVFVVAGLATALALRSYQNARWEAAAIFQQYQADMDQARVLLATSRPSDREPLERGLVQAQELLDRYQVREDAAWWRQPLVQRLPAEAQERLREDTGDFLLLLASVQLLRARYGEPEVRHAALDSARDFHERAQTSYPGPMPALLRQQRETLARLLDPDGEPVPGSASLLDGKLGPARKERCQQAQELVEEGRYLEALPIWQETARSDPRDLWAWVGQAVCHENLNQYPEATACYQTSIALAPRLPWLYFKRGVTLLRSKKFAEARADFDEFLRYRPEIAEGYINRALALEGLKQYPQAIEDCTKALDLGTRQTRVYFIRSMLRRREHDKEGAQRDAEQGRRLEPTDELSCVVRGLARLRTDPRAALADFEKALSYNPRSLDGLQNKASVLSEQLGQPGEAIKVLDQVVQLYPTFVPARAGRGVLLAREGKRAQALADAQESLRQDLQPATLYQVAGIYALTSRQQPADREEALFLLAAALRKGYGWDLIRIDTDLDPIRPLPEFRRLTEKNPPKRG